MSRFTVRLIIAFITFGVGVAAVTLWLVRPRSPQPATASVAAVSTAQPAPRPAPVNPDEAGAPSRQARPATSIEKDWRKLVGATFCFNGGQYYSPERERRASQGSEMELGGFIPGDWLPSTQSDEGAAVEFLINQIPDKGRTHAHVCPLDEATRGELAVYCLQHILKVNWPELSADYRGLFEPKRENVTSQSLLRGAIRSKQGAQKMMGLWRDYYKNGKRS